MLSSQDLNRRGHVSTHDTSITGLRAVDIETMKQIDRLTQTVEDDTALAWTMRIVGLLVVAGSLFFITRSFSLNPAYDYFFGMTALVGVVTFAASWLRSPAERWQEEGLETVRSDNRR